MAQCPNCGAPVEEWATVCENCSAALADGQQGRRHEESDGDSKGQGRRGQPTRGQQHGRSRRDGRGTAVFVRSSPRLHT